MISITFKDIFMKFKELKIHRIYTLFSLITLRIEPPLPNSLAQSHDVELFEKRILKPAVGVSTTKS